MSEFVPPTEPVVAAEDEESKGPSKAELKRLAKKAEKEAKKAEHKASRAAESGVPQQVQGDSNAVDELAHLFADAELICSKEPTGRKFYEVSSLDESLVGQSVWIRARVHTTRAVGKGVFMLLRQSLHSVQAIAWQGERISKGFVKHTAAISLESVVDVCAKVAAVTEEVQSATQKTVELKIEEIHVVSRAQELPFQVEDAGRNEAESRAKDLPIVNPDTCLNYRWIDTRTPANQAIFRIQSGVCQLFRNFFLAQKFIEIHTPKLIGGASEGGANVFNLKYFEQDACLAQSPQLYKQMCAACGGFERVFEIGPVFRAENSNTHRHLCEFTGLDFEMAINEHYYEALDVMADMFVSIFDGLNEHYRHELMLVSQQYPYEPLQYSRKHLRITFKEGIDMLHAAGITEAKHDADISTPHEKALGKLVKDKYGTDFYIMDKYPSAARPFYTMPDPNDPSVSNSYDLFIRAEEIVSGAQRIHDVSLLTERAQFFGIPIPSIQSYIDAFKHGALPHAGGGVGMERVVMLFLGLKNIRKASMFPRDPSRLTP